MLNSLSSKEQMAEAGLLLAKRFISANSIVAPFIDIHYFKRPKSGCGYYSNNMIVVYVKATAAIGKSGQAWSYPGYAIDRTAYGVIQHELGHHVDKLAGWKLSSRVRKLSGEKPLTGYAPDDAEWFAEMFRLFCTNPSLLRLIRPKTYAVLREQFESVEKRGWRNVLFDAPKRTLSQSLKKISAAKNKQ